MNAVGLARACASGLARAVSESSRAVAEAPEAPAGTPEAENSFPPSTEAPARFPGHSERIIDPDRAGGTGNAAPKTLRHTLTLTVDEALQHADAQRWRTIRPASVAAELALADEVVRLRGECEIAYLKGFLKGEIAGAGELADVKDELARLRAAPAAPHMPLDAVAEIIGCSRGGSCTGDDYPWASCCLARMNLVRRGYIAAPDRPAEENDAA